MVLMLALSAPVWSADTHSGYVAAMESIRSEELLGHVKYLADDKLEGRESGTRGGRAAAEYLAGELRRLQIRPAGIDGDYLQPFNRGFRNVLAVLPGSDPVLKHELIMVGAHYDHIGYGTRSNSRGPLGYVHNGADDNASGTSGVLELAEAFTMLVESPKRSIVFAFWDAEEKGLLGSKHWIVQPTLPRDQVALHLNVDMIGRLEADRLTVFGTRTGYGLRRLLSQHNEGPGLLVDFPWSLEPSGDHHPFFEKRIPVLFFHTGKHEDYHRPYDDVERLHADGMRRVVRLLFGVVFDMANRDESIAFRAASRREVASRASAPFGRAPAKTLRLGASWRENQPSGPGIRLHRVRPDSPAEKAGLRPGDRILQFAGRDIQTSDDLTGAVAMADNPVPIVVQRPTDPAAVELAAELDGHPFRLGITWGADDAEPGAVILTRVIPGTPAAAAGLKIGDRIYQVNGQDFANDAEFAELVKSLPGPLALLVECDGRVRTAVIHFQPKTEKRAA